MRKGCPVFILTPPDGSSSACKGVCEEPNLTSLKFNSNTDIAALIS